MKRGSFFSPRCFHVTQDTLAQREATSKGGKDGQEAVPRSVCKAELLVTCSAEVYFLVFILYPQDMMRSIVS